MDDARIIWAEFVLNHSIRTRPNLAKAEEQARIRLVAAIQDPEDIHIEQAGREYLQALADLIRGDTDE